MMAGVFDWARAGPNLGGNLRELDRHRVEASAQYKPGSQRSERRGGVLSANIWAVGSTLGQTLALHHV
jgi:hypothetical protein